VIRLVFSRKWAAAVWPLQHAKARFSELLDARQRQGPEVVSRCGFGVQMLNPFKYKGP
jgi:hypothetical protein